jgi:hypothetical protein
MKDTVLVIKDENGSIVGFTSDPSLGKEISSTSKEYIAFLEKLNTPPVPTWETIRQKRDELIKSSDWIFLPDVALKNKEAWLAYRQALRDIPQNFKDPSEVIWPEKPE